jgi:exosome complex RNA-binding protein Rrp4
MTEFEIVGSNGRRFLRIYDEDEEIHIMIAITEDETEALYDQAKKWTEADQ